MWIVALALAGAAEPSALPIKAGIYGNVRLSRMTGDLGGLEVEFAPDRPGEVETVLCQGWCNAAYRSAYEVRGASIHYDVREDIFEDGEPTTSVFHVELRASGSKVIARIDGQGPGYALKRLKRPFGLAVAREQSEASER